MATARAAAAAAFAETAMMATARAAAAAAFAETAKWWREQA